MNRLVNIGLRGLTLLSKFLLLFFLARFMAAEDVGLYGLLAATIGYGIYLVGFEFYNFANRELMVAPASGWLSLVRDQFLVYLLMYLLFFPIVLGVFWKGLLPWQYFIVFSVLLLLEHCAQEANRILVATSRQLLASVVLFLRSGLWCLFVILFMWLDPSLRTLGFTLASWLAGCVVACAIAAVCILRYENHDGMRPVDWAWIRQGIKMAIPFLFASLAIRGIYTFDRYWVEGVSNLQVLGAYTLYVGMATAVLSFLDAGVVVFFLPKLVRSARAGDYSNFKSYMKDFSINILGCVVVLSFLCWVTSLFLVEWLSSPVYRENVGLLYLLLLGSALYGVSTIPHAVLYAFGHDKPIMHSQVAAFLVFLLCAWLLAPVQGSEGIAGAMIVAFFALFIWKTVASFPLMTRALKASSSIDICGRGRE